MIAITGVVNGPVTPAQEAAAMAPQMQAMRSLEAACGCGADLRFEGVVRARETDHAGIVRALSALEYETYDAMVERSLAALAVDVAHRHGLALIVALHSRGRVEVGCTSFLLRVRSPHRAEALAAMADFIDRLKRDVPIWKHPLWATG